METSIFIARPVENVFQFLLNPDQSAPKMDPAGSFVAKTPAGPPGPGTTFVFRQRNLGRMMETKTHYTTRLSNPIGRSSSMLRSVRCGLDAL